MRNNFKLRNRMLLGYTAPVVMIIILVALVYLELRRTGEGVETLSQYQDKAIHASDLSRGLSRMVRAVRGYIITQDRTYLKGYEEGVKMYRDSAGELSLTLTFPDQKERLKKALDLGEQYIEVSGRNVALVKGGRVNEAVRVIKEGKPKALLDEIDALVNEFNLRERELLDREMETVRGRLRMVVILLLSGLFVMLVAAAGVSFYISRGIVNLVKGAVNSISSTSTEIAATMEEHEKTASAQAASVTETSATMEELGSSSRQTSEQAEKAAETAKSGLLLTEKGVKTVEEALGGMGATRDKARVISDEILRLSEQTSQISAIASLVNDIASQVNLLALNAAVEAARAGEHGRGFAVVAAEIRRLADETKKSIEKVNSLVADIQKATNSAVMAAEEGAKTIEKSSASAKEVSEAFLTITSFIKSINENAQQVMLNARQQAAAITQVVQSMNSVSAGARETASGIAQTRVGVGRLNDAAKGLSSMV